MTTTTTPRIRYHLAVPKTPEPTVLDGPDVIAWVRGYAAAIGQTEKLKVVDTTAAEDTCRVQMLQVGDALGWFTFMFQSRDDG